MTAHFLVIDQGTTSTRAIVFDARLVPLVTAQEEIPALYPQPGWVEQDPETIWNSVLRTARAALTQRGLQAADIAAVGIANQRETTLLWDRQTGRALHDAIVWQDRRTTAACEALHHSAELVTARTGLCLDPYFSATKIAWMLDNLPDARTAAEQGRLAFGTVDSFLLWRLTRGAVHAIDATNASRTLLCDIRSGNWDDAMLDLFRIPRALLPRISDSAGALGTVDPNLLGGGIHIAGIAGDQQAALIGQGCLTPGSVKATYGTGGFVLLNTGSACLPSPHRLLTTIAWQRSGCRAYALEGAIFSAGASVQWLRDGLRIIDSAAETETLAGQADPQQPVYLVPAFTGLGVPHWNSRARAAVLGITRGTTHRELARATLESIAYQTRDLLGAMRADGAAGGVSIQDSLRVDGGMAANNWAMQFLADMLDMVVCRPQCLETTAVGAAYLAGLGAGLLPEPAEMPTLTPIERCFTPQMAAEERAWRYAGWQSAVIQTLSGTAATD
jgi:glycerol kinase